MMLISPVSLSNSIECVWLPAFVALFKAPGAFPVLGVLVPLPLPPNISLTIHLDFAFLLMPFVVTQHQFIVLYVKCDSDFQSLGLELLKKIDLAPLRNV